jgi:ATP-binding cassette, subfamily B, bacterial HlyB/CyaB
VQSRALDPANVAVAGAAALREVPPIPAKDSAAGSAPDPLRALCIAARLHHITAQPAALRHSLGLGASDPVTNDQILLAAKSMGLKAKLTTTSVERLATTPLPVLALGKDGRWFVLAQFDGQRALVQHAGDEQTRPTIEPVAVLAEQWSGTVILLASQASLAGDLAKFDFTWFIPSIVRHRKLLGEVLLISFSLQLFALVSPLFFQVVMDKVLVHRGLSTLNVIIIGLLAVVVFESVLNVLRT